MVLEGGRAVLQRYRPPILIEVNEKAAAAFGLARYDAAKMLLQFNPEYHMYEVTAHRIRPATMPWLEAEGNPVANLLLTCGKA